jgi:argininosuccinate lyase
MVHLSRLSEEIAWWSNPRFGFVRVADSFSTGSSMMPNKRNPDPVELVRARAARTTAALTAMLGILKGLPLAYQRDLQEDKPPLFGAVGLLEGSLAVLTGLVETLHVDRDRMRAAAADGYSTATSMADALVRRRVPFRIAHQVVGSLVGTAESGGIATLAELPDEAFLEAFAVADDSTTRGLAAATGIVEELREAATIDSALAGADVIGGTAPDRVRAALALARERLGP